MKNLTPRNVLKPTTKKLVKSVEPRKGCRGATVKTVYCHDIFGGNNENMSIAMKGCWFFLVVEIN